MPVMTVADVLALPTLRGAEPVVAAGRSGLERAVRWVHTTELSDIAPLLREGDLLLSTGIAMPDDSGDLEAYAASLARTGAAGLVIELGRRWTELPEALVAACEPLGLPLVALRREVRFAEVAQAVGERIVDGQLSELRDAQRVHDTFTELGMAEAGPSQILDAVQRLAGATVVLESAEHQVLDYRAGPDDATGFLAGWASRSRRVPQEDRTTWDESQGLLVSRVGRRARGWGRLVVHSPDEPSARLVAVAERGAAALALHRLHDRQRDSAVRRTHHELILGLLTDPSSPELLQRCELAGLPVVRRQLVGLTIRPRFQDAGAVAPTAVVEDTIAATVHAAHELRVPALVCEIERDVRVLLSFPESTRPERKVDDLAARVSSKRSLLIGAGRPVTRAAEADRSLRESRQIVQSVADEHAGTRHPRVHRLEDVHIRGLLTMLSEDDRLRLFVSRELDELRAHDELTGAGLVDVVRALVQHPVSKSDAAASLHLSRPAFYDRLAKAARVLGVDLDDPEIRVSLHVALLADEVGQSS